MLTFSDEVSRINILLISLVPLIAFISIVWKSQIYSLEKLDIEDSRLDGIKAYCNFLENIELSDENSFHFQKHNLVLDKLIILIRHGDRGPLKDVKNLENILCNKTHLDQNKNDYDENILTPGKLSVLQSKIDHCNSSVNLNFPGDGCSIGQITKFGISQHIKLGYLVKSNYMPILNISTNDLFNSITVHTTPYSRTFQSVLSFLDGFLHKLDLDPFELLPYFKEYSFVYFCDFQNSLKYCVHDCDAVRNSVMKVYQTFKPDDDLALIVDLVKRIISPNPDVMASYESIVSVFDALNSFICHQENLPCCTETNVCVTIDHVQQIYSFISDKGKQVIHMHEYYQTSWMQIYGFLRNLIEIIQNEQMEKISIFSGHDLTIQALSMALGFADGLIPPYASRVIFEVYHSNTKDNNDNREKLIRIIYNGKDVTNNLTICQNQDKKYKYDKCVQIDSSTKLIKFIDLQNFILDTFNSIINNDSDLKNCLEEKL